MFWFTVSSIIIAFFIWCWFEWKNVRTRSLADLRAFEKAKEVYGKKMNGKWKTNLAKSMPETIESEVVIHSTGYFAWSFPDGAQEKLNKGGKFRVVFERLD